MQKGLFKNKAQHCFISPEGIRKKKNIPQPNKGSYDRLDYMGKTGSISSEIGGEAKCLLSSLLLLSTELKILARALG